jgi:hypothetical protein
MSSESSQVIKEVISSPTIEELLSVPSKIDFLQLLETGLFDDDPVEVDAPDEMSKQAKRLQTTKYIKYGGDVYFQSQCEEHLARCQEMKKLENVYGTMYIPEDSRRCAKKVLKARQNSYKLTDEVHICHWKELVADLDEGEEWGEFWETTTIGFLFSVNRRIQLMKREEQMKLQNEAQIKMQNDARLLAEKEEADRIAYQNSTYLGRVISLFSGQ